MTRGQRNASRHLPRSNLLIWSCKTNRFLLPSHLSSKNSVRKLHCRCHHPDHMAYRVVRSWRSSHISFQNVCLLCPRWATLSGSRFPVHRIQQFLHLDFCKAEGHPRLSSIEKTNFKARASSRNGADAALHPESQALSIGIKSCHLRGLDAGSIFNEDHETKDSYLRLTG